MFLTSNNSTSYHAEFNCCYIVPNVYIFNSQKKRIQDKARILQYLILV